MKAKKATLIKLLLISLLAVTIVFIISPQDKAASINNENKDLTELVIRKSDSTQITFFVEIASDSKQREKGLMFRESMAKDNGMLFIFDKEKIVEMWMKNTQIPLDMLFIGKDMTIKHIATNTKPQSLDIISSGVEVIAVLEINAGLSDKNGIKTGDILIKPDVSNIYENK